MMAAGISFIFGALVIAAVCGGIDVPVKGNAKTLLGWVIIVGIALCTASVITFLWRHMP